MPNIRLANSLWFLLAALVIVFDRLSKTWAIQHLKWGEAVEILPVLNLQLAFNTGAAYSFLHHASGWQNLFFITLAVLISLWIIYSILTETKAKVGLLNAGFALVLGGALSNAWDRLWYQAVIDFINPHWGTWYFAIFNVADSAITVGAICLIWHWWFEKHS